MPLPLQAQLGQLVEEAKKASERLAQEREALELDKAAFAQERQRIAGLTQQTAQQVTLNIGKARATAAWCTGIHSHTRHVGGRRFTTTQVTLCNAPEPSLFAAMFSGRHPLQPDETGCFFIDRDPTVRTCAALSLPPRQRSTTDLTAMRSTSQQSSSEPRLLLCLAHRLPELTLPRQAASCETEPWPCRPRPQTSSTCWSFELRLTSMGSRR